MKRILVVLFTSVMIFSQLSCSRKSDETNLISDKDIRMKAQVHIDGLPSEITGNSLQNIQYKWSFSDSTYPPENSIVKVHFVNDENRILFQDDHSIPSPVENLVYSRDILIPLIPRPQNIRMLVGLYNKNTAERYLLPNTDGLFKSKIEVFLFKVIPPLYVDDLPEARIAFGQGWHQKEFNSDQTDSWRWMSQQAHCRLKGADRNLTLYIHGWVPIEQLPEKQTLTLTLKDEVIGTYTDLAGEFIIKLEIPSNRIGAGETEELIISASTSFQPSKSGNESDTRIMSAMIKDFFFN